MIAENSKGKRNFSFDMKYGMVYGIWYVLSLLPFCVLYAISDVIYFFVYYIIRYRRGTVRDNLESSFPEKSPTEIVAIEKKFYHFFCDYIVETLKFCSISDKEMHRRMIFKGIEKEVMEVFEKEKKGFVFLYLGHYGNWEWITYVIKSIPPYAHGGQIYHPLNNKVFDKAFLDVRSRFGGECIPMKQTLRRIIELKRQSKPTVIGFISDQLPKWNSIHFFVPFLNHETAVFTGAEQIGKQVGAVFFFGEITRPRRGYYECTFKRMEEPAEKHTEYDMTVQFMDRLEQMIRKTPELWLWTHKRWKRTKEEWQERQKKGL